MQKDKTKSEEKENETVPPQTELANELLLAGLNVQLPSEYQSVTLTLPEFVTPESIPVGGVFVGKVLGIVGDFTGNPDMVNCQNVIFQVPGKIKQIMFPVTGELAQALLRIPGAGQGLSGKILAMKRQTDRVAKRFKNRQFSFEYVKVLGGEAIEKMFPPIPVGELPQSMGIVRREK